MNDVSILLNLGLSKWAVDRILNAQTNSVPKIIDGNAYTLDERDVNNIYTFAGEIIVTIPKGIHPGHNSHHTAIGLGGVVIFDPVADVTMKTAFDGDDRSNGRYAPATLFLSAPNAFILGGNITQ